MSNLETLLFFILDVIITQHKYKNDKCLITSEDSGQDKHKFIKSIIDNFREKMLMILNENYVEFSKINKTNETKLIPNIPAITNNSRIFNNNLLGNRETIAQKDINVYENSPNPFLDEFCLMKQNIFNSPSYNKIDEKFMYKKSAESEINMDNFIQLEKIQSFDLHDMFKYDNFNKNKVDNNKIHSLIDESSYSINSNDKVIS